MKWLHEWWERCYGLEGNLRLLKDPDPDVRKRANDRIWDLTKTVQDAVRLIIAAGDEYPDDETSPWLIRRFWDEPHPEFIDAISQVYDRLEFRKQSRQTALRLLTEMKTDEAFALVAELLQRPSSRTVELTWVFVPLDGGMSSPVDPKGVTQLRYLLRDFSKYDQLQDRGNLLDFPMLFAEKGLITFDDFPEFQQWCLSRCRLLIDRDLPDYEFLLQHGLGVAATSHLNDNRVKQCCVSAREFVRLLKLTRFGEFAGFTAILEYGTQSGDDDIRLTAVMAMVSKDIPVADQLIEEIASRPDLSHRLAVTLHGLRRLDLFPEVYRTQKALAEAEMVHWLQYPTEMARPPEEIELLKVVQIDHPQDGPSECYCYRYRHPSFEDGKWLVGMAGPYPIAAQPTPNGSWTFSHFDEWTEATADTAIDRLISGHLNRDGDEHGPIAPEF